MADQSQSQRMRTRSQGFQAASNGGGVRDTSAPSGSGTEQPDSDRERSSVTAPTQSQTQPELSATVPDIVEPVISASDRRIRNLLAKTSTGKMMLDNHLKEMTKMAERHMEYDKDGEGAEMLVDRATQLKSKVNKGEELEESLINNLSNLTLLIELFNLEADEEQMTEGVRLGNKVTSEIYKLKNSSTNSEPS